MDYLFVYGTLAPGRPNEHVLRDVKGDWIPATVRGTLYEEGWGAAQGYPGIILDDSQSQVDGLLFASEMLSQHWQRLDDFEGEGYRRVITAAVTKEGKTVQAHIYELTR